MKRTLMTVLSCILIVGMAACGSQTKNSNTNESTQTSEENNAAMGFYK